MEVLSVGKRIRTEWTLERLPSISARRDSISPLRSPTSRRLFSRRSICNCQYFCVVCWFTQGCVQPANCVSATTRLIVIICLRKRMNEGSKNKPSKKYLIKLYTVTLFYQLANALILPMVPYLANNLNATSQQYSLTFTVYYIAQLISNEK